MAKKEELILDPTDKQIAIVYGDGSSDFRYEVYGCGITGYIYNKKAIGSNSGDTPSKYYITEKGYIEYEQFPKSGLKTVIPCFYFDGVFGYKGKGTSDIAELLAFINGMENILVEELGFSFEKIIYKTDSSYVVLAIDHLQSIGESVIGNQLKANEDLIRKIYSIIKNLKEKEIELEVIKVQGHSTSLGNNMADRLANIGRITGRQQFFIRENDKHWSKADKPHPMTRFKQLFFINTDSPSTEYLYSIMDYKTGVEVGKRTHEAMFGLALMKKAIEKVELIKELFNSHISPINLLSTIDLNVLFNRDTSYYFDLLNKDCFYFQNKNKSLVNLFGDIVAKDIYPPGLAVQAFEKMNGLYSIINVYKDWKAGKEIDKSFKIHDITSSFYEISKKGKCNCIVANGVNIIDMEVKEYNEKLKIPLSLGIDTLSRNSFKQLETSSPKVYLILYKSSKVIEYCTIIETSEGDIGIYCNPYSCKVFLQ